jgi:geranylgeranyl reductase family protein
MTAVPAPHLPTAAATDLPACDTLVVGAGPAGSACALWLARHGQRVLLVDQHEFPRDKVCGDGLIPDAHRALDRLGLLGEVMAAAQPAQHVACIAPRGGRVDVPGRVAVLPRRELDDILKRGAERAGAQFLAPARFDAPLLDGTGRVVGATLRTPNGPREVRARWVVLATGAVPQALIAAGVCDRRTPSGVALRGYIQHPTLGARLKSLEVVWHKRLRKGYGWIFPAPGGVFNIGVGLAHSHAQTGTDGRASMADVNLRELFRTFCEIHEPARQLLAEGQWTSPLKGAPLRCSLEGAQLSRPGLLVAGEAAGSTYAFTGEGIGKALETGLLAAEALMSGADDAAVSAGYAAAIGALKPRFDLYERANHVNDHPWLADLVIWRARRDARILRRMAGVLEETGNPGNLVSLRGIFKLFVPAR